MQEEVRRWKVKSVAGGFCCGLRYMGCRPRAAVVIVTEKGSLVLLSVSWVCLCWRYPECYTNIHCNPHNSNGSKILNI